MSLTLSWNERNAPLNALASCIDNDQLLEAMQNMLTSNFDPSEVFGEEKVIDFVKTNYSPDDVFADDDLEAWARANGFKKEFDE